MLTTRAPLRSRLASLICAGLLAAALGACGSEDEKRDDAKDEKSATPTPSPAATTAAPASYLPVPSGVALTAPGTELDLGEHAVVAYEPRQDQVGVLAVTVDRIERTSFQESFTGWTVDDVTAARTPYFVRFTVVNVGDEELGGRSLDNVLWASDGTTLNAANFYTAAQQPLCAGGTLPAAFPAGTDATMCAVYFIAPAQELQAVTFQPPGGLDPVLWKGAVSKVTKPSKKPKQPKQGKTGTTDKKTGKPAPTRTVAP